MPRARSKFPDEMLTVKLDVRAPLALKQRLSRQADRLGISRSRLILECVTIGIEVIEGASLPAQEEPKPAA